MLVHKLGQRWSQVAILIIRKSVRAVESISWLRLRLSGESALAADFESSRKDSRSRDQVGCFAVSPEGLEAVIKSAASTASPSAWGALRRRLGMRGRRGSRRSPSRRGGCASSRLDHGLTSYVIRGGCAGSDLFTNSRAAFNWLPPLAHEPGGL